VDSVALSVSWYSRRYRVSVRRPTETLSARKEGSFG
jgi:hypothetical protein